MTSPSSLQPVGSFSSEEQRTIKVEVKSVSEKHENKEIYAKFNGRKISSDASDVGPILDGIKAEIFPQFRSMFEAERQKEIEFVNANILILHGLRTKKITPRDLTLNLKVEVYDFLNNDNCSKVLRIYKDVLGEDWDTKKMLASLHKGIGEDNKSVSEFQQALTKFPVGQPISTYSLAQKKALVDLFEKTPDAVKGSYKVLIELVDYLKKEMRLAEGNEKTEIKEESASKIDVPMESPTSTSEILSQSGTFKE